MNLLKSSGPALLTYSARDAGRLLKSEVRTCGEGGGGGSCDEQSES